MINDAVLTTVGQGSPRGASWVEGKDAVREMKKAGFGSWREVEWPGYYVKYLLHDAISSGFIAGFTPEVEKKHYLARGSYLWDVRVVEEESTKLWWADRARIDELVRTHDGIGLVIFLTFYEKDRSGAFRKWHMKLGGGKSEYVSDRIARGAPPRTRKGRFSVTMSIAIFLSAADIQQGTKEGWLTEYAYNMRNQDGTLRNPKYMLHLDEMPIDKLVGIRNFNMEPKEFEEIYSDLPPC